MRAALLLAMLVGCASGSTFEVTAYVTPDITRVTVDGHDVSIDTDEHSDRRSVDYTHAYASYAAAEAAPDLVFELYDGDALAQHGEAHVHDCGDECVDSTVALEHQTIDHAGFTAGDWDGLICDCSDGGTVTGVAN